LKLRLWHLLDLLRRLGLLHLLGLERTNQHQSGLLHRLGLLHLLDLRRPVGQWRRLGLWRLYRLGFLAGQ
jgi:hypothetical protein